MSYTPTVYSNLNGPPINAENLNKNEQETSRISDLLDSLEQTVSNLDDRVSGIAGDLGDNENDISTLSNSLSSLEQTVNDLGGTVQNTINDLDDNKQETSRISDSLSSLEQTVSDLSDALQNTEDNIQTLIDEKIATRLVKVTLLKDNWQDPNTGLGVSGDNKYQTITVTGISSDEDSQKITWAPAVASREDCERYGIIATGFAENQLTFTAFVKDPEVDVVIYITIEDLKSEVAGT